MVHTVNLHSGVYMAGFVGQIRTSLRMGNQKLRFKCWVAARSESLGLLGCESSGPSVCRRGFVFSRQEAWSWMRRDITVDMSLCSPVPSVTTTYAAPQETANRILGLLRYKDIPSRDMVMDKPCETSSTMTRSTMWTLCSWCPSRP